MALKPSARLTSRAVLEIGNLTATQFADICCYCMDKGITPVITDCWFYEGRHFMEMEVDMTGKTILIDSFLKEYLSKQI